MIKKFDDLTVVEFGHGTVTVELGKYGTQYAVFINNTDTPGMPGQLAPKTKNTRGYEPDEIVLVFPTKERAALVVNSLFDGELIKIEGGRQPSAHWSHDNPGLADQYRAEAMAARRSAGFEQDAYDVAPVDIAAAIEALQAECETLVEALEEGLRAIGDHHAPDDCYATGPMTGDPFRDLVQCPACSFIAMCDDALAAYRNQGGES